MRHKIISVSKAKATLLEITRNLQDGEAYLLTKDGEPVGALVPMEDYEALLETADVLADSAVMTAMESSFEDLEKGRIWARDSSGKWIKAEKNQKKRKRTA
jgi:antitoxin YefM